MIKNSFSNFILIILIAAFSSIFILSCGFVSMLFDIEKEGEAFYLNVKVSGYLSIDPSIFIGGDVYIGFIDIDPQSSEGIPNPVPWANFSGSYLYLGSYTGGEGGSYMFTFEDVPEGRYILLAIIDTNGNALLDMGPSGDPAEPVGLYPMGDDGPHLMDFKSDQLNISISMFYEGFFEDFNDGLAQNWVDDETNRWSVDSYYYAMSGSGDGNYAFSYYDRYFRNFTYRVSIQQTAGSTYSSWRGIFFRSNNPSGLNNTSFSGYMLGFDGNGNWQFIRYDLGGAYSIIGSGFSPHLNPGSEQNIIEVQCYDTIFTIYFNGFQVATLIDSIYSDGMVGLFVSDDSAGNEFHFDDVTLMW
ncbi:MAG: hypothetical protein ACUVWJ_10205 [Spirochaetota bacterium]